MSNVLNSSLQDQEELDRKLVSDLFDPRPEIFWPDLLVSSTLGWGAFVLACRAELFSGAMFASAAIAVLALYRALAFVHELSHLRASALPGFSAAWNLLIGIPLLFPSFVYVGVHADHHRPSTYATGQDPEYQPFAGKPPAIVGFLAYNLLLPALLLVRFLVLAPVSFLVPPLRRVLERHASALSMNLAYVRSLSEAERARIRRFEALIVACWSGGLALGVLGIVPVRAFFLWYALTATIGFINSLRTLGAHRYRNETGSLDRTGQLLDSIDTPGSPLTELWAPVGLRYHALHHYFPSLPYHNLAAAHRRFVIHLSPEAAYRRTISPGLWFSLKDLWCYDGKPTLVK